MNNFVPIQGNRDPTFGPQDKPANAVTSSSGSGSAESMGREILGEESIQTSPQVQEGERKYSFNLLHLQKEALLRWGGTELRKTSSMSPISPIKGDNANDVYISDLKEDSPNVVFKKGEKAALMAEIGYRLSLIVGIENALLPARQGIAHVAAKKSTKNSNAPAGKEVTGMVQLKVENTFSQASGARYPLDLRQNTAAREMFYENIHMPSFIECFIATILLRPQDGKIVDLGQSNVLFQEIPETNPNENSIGIKHLLRPVIIDNDETMPPNNQFSTTVFGMGQKAYSPQPLKQVHPIRNGLMAFPQAKMKLEAHDRDLAIRLIRGIVEQKTQIQKYLESVNKKEEAKGSRLFQKEKIGACIEVVDRLEVFLKEQQENLWTLQQLFFTIFPEYEIHWNVLEGQSDEDKASMVGEYTLETLIRHAERRA